MGGALESGGDESPSNGSVEELPVCRSSSGRLFPVYRHFCLCLSRRSVCLSVECRGNAKTEEEGRKRMQEDVPGAQDRETDRMGNP